MHQVGAFEAKTHLSQLLDRVQQGEEILITRHGRPVAKLIRVESDSARRARIRKAMARVVAVRNGVQWDGAPIAWDELRQAGRR